VISRCSVACVLVLTGCGFLAPDDGVDFEWSLPPNALAAGEELESVEIDRAPDVVMVRGTFTLWTSCYGLELDHEVVMDVLQLRLTQKKSHTGCPAAEVMAHYVITISDVSIASRFAVIHDYQGSTERVALQGSL